MLKFLFLSNMKFFFKFLVVTYKRFRYLSIRYINFPVHRCPRLASLVGITERETGVGKLGWHGNSTGFDRKKMFFSLFCVTKKKRKTS